MYRNFAVGLILLGNAWVHPVLAQEMPPSPPPAPPAESAPKPAPETPPAKAPATPATPAAPAPPTPPQPTSSTAPSHPAEGDFKDGVVYGRVVDITNGKPIPGATVAVTDAKGKVLVWAKTDVEGRYAVAADALKLLRLEPSRQKGLLSRLAGGVVSVVKAPVKLAGDALNTTADVAKQTLVEGATGAVKGVGASVVTGTPAPIASQIAGNVVNATKEKLTQKAQEKVLAAQESSLQSLSGQRLAQPKEKRQTLLPGELLLAVTAPGFKDVKGQAGAVWLEAPLEEEARKVGSGAWLETVKLAPAASDKPSAIESAAILLKDAKLEPSMVPPGSTVKINVKLETPAGFSPKLRVFAREDKKRTVVELKPGANGLYSGEMALDPKMEAGPSVIGVFALRTEPVEVKLPKNQDDPLLKFAAQLDDLDPGKPYDFDPRIMASENRVDLPVTVLDPKRGSAPTPAEPKKG